MPDDLPFTIDLWSAGYDRLEQTLGRVSNLAMARAAFEAAVKVRPGEWILLRHKARVILKSIKD